VRKEFLFVETDPRSPQRGQHGFVQGIIAEVAAATLSRHDRSAKHLAVARHLESLGDEELTGLVAAHYVEAQRAAPVAEAAELAAPARGWLSRAGTRALSLGSPEQALDLFEQALDLTRTGAERAWLLEAAGEAAERAAAYGEALSHLEEAVAYHETAGDVNAIGRATAGVVRVLGGLGRHHEAIERCERALEAVGDGGDERVRAELACELAGSYGLEGSCESALQWSETALSLAEKLDDIALLARSIGTKSYALFNLGRHREAVMLARGQVALADAAGSLVEQAWARSWLGLFAFGEDPRESLSAFTESAELARRAGDRRLERFKLSDVAELSIFVGAWSEARAAMTELREREIPLWEGEAFLNVHEAMLAALTGDPVAASGLLEEQRAGMAGSEFLAARTTYFKCRSLVYLAAGDLEVARRSAAEGVSADPMGADSPSALSVQARACLWQRDAEGAREARSMMKGFGGRWMTAQRCTVEAGLAALEGREEEAAEGYRKAVEALRALDCTLDLALCELDLVLLLGPDHGSATVAKEARDIFTELGAKPFLERLNDAAGLEQVQD
jgi:tetratricopeptide (TPR) repeat protein